MRRRRDSAQVEDSVHGEIVDDGVDRVGADGDGETAVNIERCTSPIYFTQVCALELALCRAARARYPEVPTEVEPYRTLHQLYRPNSPKTRPAEATLKTP